MFSRKTRKLSVAVLVLVVAVSFSFCIINNCKAVDVNANDIEVDNVSIVFASTQHKVYESYPDEVFPALPLEAELYSNRKPIGKKAAITWTTDGMKSLLGPDWVYYYTYSFISLPDGYKLSENYIFEPVPVTIIEDMRPTVVSLNDCTVNVIQNQNYTLPETLKGTVDGVNLVDVAVEWNDVADTSQTGTKVYTATAVNSFEYKVPDNKITAKLTLTVGTEETPIGFKHYYQKDETFKPIEMNGYTLLGWAKADNASLGVFDAGAVVQSEGDYFAILAKLEYLGVSFRIYEQGVRFGFALRFFGLEDNKEVDGLKTAFVDTLLKKILEKATFTATIYSKEFNYTYTEAELKYGYIEDYQGYVSNLVFNEISKEQFDEPIKVDAEFVIASKTLSVEGQTCTIREKAQKAYDETKFDVEDQATIDKMAQMYGVKVNES